MKYAIMFLQLRLPCSAVSQELLSASCETDDICHHVLLRGLRQAFDPGWGQGGRVLRGAQSSQLYLITLRTKFAFIVHNQVDYSYQDSHMTACRTRLQSPIQLIPLPAQNFPQKGQSTTQQRGEC